MTLETSFCMESGQVKTGLDKDDTYLKMLQEVFRVTAPIAYGVAAEYSNVISLVKGLRKYGPTALENLKVCRHCLTKGRTMLRISRIIEVCE